MSQGVHGAEAKDQQHKDGHDQSQQHGAAAAQIAHLFFEYGGYRLRESRKLPAQLQALHFLHLRTSSSFVQILSAKLSADAKVKKESYEERQRRQEEKRSETCKRVPVRDLRNSVRCESRR